VRVLLGRLCLGALALDVEVAVWRAAEVNQASRVVAIARRAPTHAEWN
jgi:hypothetical protein